jgi:protoporphyrinogen oxidase
MRKHVVIIGGGLAGLSCGYELARAGLRVTVLEREGHVGGLAASFEEGNRETAGQPGSDYWSYDFGPHRFHSAESELMAHAQEILGENHIWSKRLSRIFLFDKFFDYPIVLANVFKSMPLRMIFRILFDYLWIRFLHITGLKRLQDRNLKEWVERRFGAALARIFFIEYTEKTWGIPATEISAAWASQRIALFGLLDTIVKTIFKPRDVPRTLVTDFIYPRVGGIGELSRRYASQIESMGGQVLVGAPLVGIHCDEQEVLRIEYEKNGEEHAIQADEYISTIPVTALVRRVTPAAPPAVRHAASNLGHVSIVFIYLKVGRSQVVPDNWIYLPQKKLRIHRISEFKNFSQLAAPPDKTMICAEITCRAGDRFWRASTEELSQIALEDLSEIGLLQPEEVLSSSVKRIRYAYPLYDLHYDGNLKTVMDFVHTFTNLKSGGRQGLFRYNNMDQSIDMGRKMAHAICQVGDADYEAVATGKTYFG